MNWAKNVKSGILFLRILGLFVLFLFYTESQYNIEIINIFHIYHIYQKDVNWFSTSVIRTKNVLCQLACVIHLTTRTVSMIFADLWALSIHHQTNMYFYLALYYKYKLCTRSIATSSAGHKILVNILLYINIPQLFFRLASYSV